MDIEIEKYIFESIEKGFESGFVAVKYPDEGYPRFITFSDGKVNLHACGETGVIWHFGPGKFTDKLEHISIKSINSKIVRLQFGNNVKDVSFSIDRPGVYWGR